MAFGISPPGFLPPPEQVIRCSERATASLGDAHVHRVMGGGSSEAASAPSATWTCCLARTRRLHLWTWQPPPLPSRARTRPLIRVRAFMKATELCARARLPWRPSPRGRRGLLRSGHEARPFAGRWMPHAAPLYMQLRSAACGSNAAATGTQPPRARPVHHLETRPSK